MSRLQRITAWFCLVAALFMGVSSRQAWVLCLEPEGGIALEPAFASSRCGGCSDADPAALGAGIVAALGEVSGCPCIDIPLAVGAGDSRLRPKPIELQLHGGATLPAAIVPAGELFARASFLGATPDAPRPRSGLALIRSVVLRV